MKIQKPQRPCKSATATTSTSHKYSASNQATTDDGQLSLPEIAPAPTSKTAMQYTYLDNPVQPTGRQNRFVLSKLREHPNGLETIELTAMGVADPRPRIRDLRELGWRIETIQPEPHDVGRYVLMTGRGDL